ncbi:ATP-binding protein [Desulfovibrio gilichinskyi]|uniref:Anti-sigma regulatory factor (Ser/Thr protein kinase) n=1 Tax=Desulfovibrio gilichinskyi TaxID=1519643 RepID=A0A1X7CZ15_9BACT|nr:ATP-binding protein [Desulfovibrio gilichinskyi]SMF05698.1 Anti-sigma regulatory factor (Ser/Thr protein kinase) [Desulfovibrio gilichinskyi]
MISNKIFGIQIPAQLASISIVVIAARECAKIRGFSPEDVQALSLAVEESLINSIEMGFGGSAEEIDILFLRTPSGLGVKIKSLCLPLEPEKLPQYCVRRMSEHNDTTGLSFHLVKQMVDNLHVFIGQNGERELSFEKYILEKRVQEDTKRKRTERISTTHTTRFAIPDDAENISRLVLRAHGEVLFGESIYYPDLVREMIETKDMFSVVYEAEDGELIGHFALIKEAFGPSVEELTYVVIDGHYRSPGASKVPELLMENAKSRGVYAVTAYAVTNHVHSQRGLQRDEFTENCLFLALNAASKHKDKKENEIERIGNLGYTKYFGTRNQAPVFLPPHHRNMIMSIYAHAGIEPSVSEDNSFAGTESGSPRIITESELQEGWISIVVQAYGRDTFSHVRSEFYKARADGVPSIQIMLPLANSATPEMCKKFEQIGLFFAGISPGYNCSENLVLQYLNGVKPDFESVQVLSDFGKTLKEYVYKCWEKVPVDYCAPGE